MLEPGRTSWTLPLDAVRLGPADDATEVTAAQVRDVVTQIIAATDADAAAERDAQAARLQARIKRIETAQNSQILELEQLPADPADTAAQLQALLRPHSKPPTPPCSTNSPPWATSCPACQRPSKPA